MELFGAVTSVGQRFYQALWVEPRTTDPDLFAR